MGTGGDALDNAVAESFFATLECELLDRHPWPTGRPFARRGSTSSRSSTTVSAATRPWTTPAPRTTSNPTHQQHPPHSQAVHESGQLHVSPVAFAQWHQQRDPSRRR